VKDVQLGTITIGITWIKHVVTCCMKQCSI